MANELYVQLIPYVHECTKYMIILLYVFRSTVSTLYIGISLNMSQLFGDVYLNVLLSGCLEVVACIIMFILVKHKGRRLPVACVMLLSGISSCVAAPFEIIPGRYLK